MEILILVSLKENQKLQRKPLLGVCYKFALVLKEGNTSGNASRGKLKEDGITRIRLLQFRTESIPAHSVINKSVIDFTFNMHWVP